MALKILANDGMDQSAVDLLVELGHEVDTNHYENDELVKQMRDSDVIVIRSATKLREQIINQVKGSRIKLFIRAGVGIDNIDHIYAQEQGITVKNTPNSSSAAVAELAIGHMFALVRHIHISNVSMRKGEWNKKAYSGTEIAGKTLGLYGMGRIAREVAQRAHALGMKVIYTDLRGEIPELNEYTYMTPDELMKNSDMISLHVPFDRSIGAVIQKEQFDLMKDGVYIINAARGGVVCEKSLLEALNSGKVAGAGIDVFEEEPTHNHELVNHPKVCATPHIGASTAEAQERIGNETISVIREFFNV